MCGASSQQEDMYGQQAAFYKEMTAHYTEVFGKEQGILDELTATFEPILKAGPNQTGFSDAERTTLNTQATEGVATNYAKAKQALGDDLGARGGSDFIPAGSDTQMQERLAATGAAEKSSLENKITMDDYKAGHDNWQTAVNVLGGVAAQENPNGTAGAATSAGTAAADTANQMAMADNSMWSSVIGGLSGVAGAATGAWVGNATKKP